MSIRSLVYPLLEKLDVAAGKSGVFPLIVSAQLTKLNVKYQSSSIPRWRGLTALVQHGLPFTFPFPPVFWEQRPDGYLAWFDSGKALGSSPRKSFKKGKTLQNSPIRFSLAWEAFSTISLTSIFLLGWKVKVGNLKLLAAPGQSNLLYLKPTSAIFSAFQSLEIFHLIFSAFGAASKPGDGRGPFPIFGGFFYLGVENKSFLNFRRSKK